MVISLDLATVIASITTERTGVAYLKMCIKSPAPSSPDEKSITSDDEMSEYALKQIASTPHYIDTAAKFFMKAMPVERACEFTSVASATGEMAVSIAVSNTVPSTDTTIRENITNIRIMMIT